MIAGYELDRESDERLYVQNDIDGVCPAHFHRKIELVYILKGHKKIICDNKEIYLQADQIFIADSYKMHMYLKSEDSTQIIVVLPNHMLKDYYLLYNNKRLKDCVIKDQALCKLLKKYFERLTMHKTSPLLAQGSVDILLGMIVEFIGMEDNNMQFNQLLLEEVLAYINEHYKEDITLDSLAEHFGYSKYYFSRMFNNFLHINLSTYLSTIRLLSAIEDLRMSKKSVLEAALDSGFNSIQTFYRVAKKNYSYTNIRDLIEKEDKIQIDDKIQ